MNQKQQDGMKKTKLIFPQLFLEFVMFIPYYVYIMCVRLL